jgi:hypothetical protein
LSLSPFWWYTAVDSRIYTAERHVSPTAHFLHLFGCSLVFSLCYINVQKISNGCDCVSGNHPGFHSKDFFTVHRSDFLIIPSLIHFSICLRHSPFVCSGYDWNTVQVFEDYMVIAP